MLRRSCARFATGKSLVSRGSPEFSHRLNLKKGKKTTMLHKLGTSKPNNMLQYAQMTIHDIAEWALSYSPWPLTFGLACCAVEMMHAYTSRYDLDRFGIVPRATPRQAEVMIVSFSYHFICFCKMSRSSIFINRSGIRDPRIARDTIRMSCGNAYGDAQVHAFHSCILPYQADSSPPSVAAIMPYFRWACGHPAHRATLRPPG